jgi:hypothetical protein
MGGWCGVCDGAAKGRRAKAAERATVPSSPSDSLAAGSPHSSQPEPATSGGKQERWLQQCGAKLLRYAKSPGKTPAEPACIQTTTTTTLL